ncbi:hypothetical protein JKF63_08001 [Porcisia hertigi]|uniref:Uncharacterized protein n=1 Tax=Porcisia hertigi TaxID=2761500 RepID=A0A836IPF9_9TRYP|nr:hypothetical protein JKF63_08001 [Porcisia hertigi]
MENPAGSETGTKLTDNQRSAFRRRLLIELSVLRSRYARLSDYHHHNDSGHTLPVPAPVNGFTSAVSNASSADEETGALCQSDRDAIEALFHSIDDFTCVFNEGRGEVMRNDIVSKIMSDIV